MARERIATPSASDVSKFAKECRVSAESSQNLLNIAYAMEEKINFKNNLKEWWIK